MVAEKRIVNPVTGGEKGQKLARFDLLPGDALWALAEHFGRGALKYTKYGECNCAALATRNNSTVAACADLATTNSGEKSDLKIQSSQKSKGKKNEQSQKNGRTQTQSMLAKDPNVELSTENSEAQKYHTARVPGNMDSPLKPTKPLSQNPVDYVKQPTETDMLTTTTTREPLGDRFVTGATSESDLWKSEEPNGQKEHLPGCKALRIVELGDRNWERGTDWSLNFAAAQRHMWQWWNGEDIDAETGSSHVIAAMWHMAALYHFMTTHPELDDRP